MPSMINEKKKIVFLHLSKTAGITVTTILENHQFVPIDLEHNAGHIGYRSCFDNYFTFGFIRHPEQWYISLYRFFRTHDWKIKTKSFEEYRSDNINDFIDNLIRTNNFMLGEVFEKFFGDSTDFIGKTENLIHDLDKVLSLHGIQMSQTETCIKFNVSKKFPAEIDQEHKEWIRASCDLIYKRFGYEYE